jgi:nucleoside-diphosphate-sugar epimerase
MKILITGASGFVGTNIQKFFRMLNKNLELVSIRYPLNKEFDLKADVIIHLSGIAHDLKNRLKENDYYKANNELTKQLFDSYLNSEAKIFIFLSSVNAVKPIENENFTEENYGMPITTFGKSKRLAEEYLLSQPHTVGKKIFILRPCMIHGPGNKGNLNLLYQIVVKRIPWLLGAFQNQRSFCSIDNVCYVIQQILEREEIPSGIYNLADDEALSTNELIELIASATNRKVRILNIPKKLIYTIAKIGDVLHLPLNTERLDKLTENFVVSNAKIKTALGIEKLPTSVREGLVKTISSFKKS